jgi:hypothetical protein
MAIKAAAKQGGQAAIGDIINKTNFSSFIGQLAGNSTVVIHNLHITQINKAANETSAGLIEYFLESGIGVDDYWRRQLDVVRRHWEQREFESAREELWSVGARMRDENALPEARSACSKLLTSLMRADPYYAEVMERILPIIRIRPGIVQAVLAKGFPEFDIQRFRHAMYYGEIMGDIQRIKRGNSYGLFESRERTE